MTTIARSRPHSAATRAVPTVSDALSGTERAHGLDRWIFVTMAAWFIALTLVGFVPDSVMKLDLVRAGKRPDFPLALHVHAAVMGAFLCLLLVQSWLVATGRQARHAQLGAIGAGLAVAVVASAIVLVPTMYHQTWEALQLAPANARAEWTEKLYRSERLFARQIAIGVLFTGFIAIALRVRHRDPGLHKRLIFLATALPIPAGISRMTWLPFTPSFTTADFYTLFAVAPLFFWDVLRNRRVHRAYWIWLVACLPFVAFVHAVGDMPWWHIAAHRILGA